MDQTRVMAKAYSTNDLDLGYVFSPPCHPSQLCHRQLDITLHETPTLRCYDPEVVIFRVVPDLLGNSKIKVRHPWKGKKKHHVFSSIVILRDRVDKVVESFTFGGELSIASNNERTICSLISTAPILQLLSWSSVEMILADEFEILLAIRREVWDEEHKRTSFDKHLSEGDPFNLYLSCLQNLQKKFSHFPNPVPEDLLGFIHFLRVEIKRLHSEGFWPLYVPQMAEIL